MAASGFLARKASPSERIAQADPRDAERFVPLLEAAGITPADLRACFDRITPKETETVLGQLPRTFWQANPTALMLFKAALERMNVESHQGEGVFFKKMAELVKKIAPDAGKAGSLMDLVVQVCWQKAAVPRTELTAFLKSLGPDAGIHIVRALAKTEHPDKAAEREKFVHRLVTEAGWPAKEEWIARSAALAGRDAALADSDAALVQILAAAPKSKHGAALSSELAKTLAMRDPDRFVAVMSAYAKSAAGSAAAYVVDSGLPMTVCKTVADGLGPKQRGEFLKGCGAKLAGGSFERVEDFARLFPPAALPDEVTQQTATLLLAGTKSAFTNWTSRLSPQQAAKLLDETDPSDFDARIQKLVDLQWKQNWLDARLAFPDLPKEDILRTLSGVGQSIADPAVMYRYAEQLPESFRAEAREIAEESEFESLLLRNPGEAMRMCERKGADFTAKHQERLLQAQAGASPQTTLAALKETRDPALRSRLMASIVGSESLWVDQTLRTKLCLDLVGTAPDLTLYKKEVTRLLESITDVSSQAGIDLLDKLPSSMRSEATVTLVQKWAKHEPVAASEWIANAQLGASRDAVISTLVASSHDDPEMAFANASVIKDPKLREDAARQVIKAWESIAPEAVYQLLQKSSLPKEEVAVLAQELGITNR